MDGEVVVILHHGYGYQLIMRLSLGLFTHCMLDAMLYPIHIHMH